MQAQNNKPCFVGIDVGKKTLDICVLPQKVSWQVENNGDFLELLKTLQDFSPRLVVLEPTGGYEKAVLNELLKAGVPVSRQHALRIHHHAKSRGKRAKTDPIDAETIAHYAQSHVETIEPLKALDDVEEELRQFVARREDLVKIRTSEKNRLQSPGVCDAIKSSCQKLVDTLNTEIETLEAEIQERLSVREAWRQKKELLLSVPGIGETVASALVAYLPELGTVSHKQIAALVGVVPYARQSGQYQGEQHIGGGRTSLRCLLYMASLAAIRFNPILAALYARLKAKGKKPKVAIVACMHKLLRILNAMIQKQKAFTTA
jgi:transposase